MKKVLSKYSWLIATIAVVVVVIGAVGLMGSMNGKKANNQTPEGENAEVTIIESEETPLAATPQDDSKGDSKESPTESAVDSEATSETTEEPQQANSEEETPKQVASAPRVKTTQTSTSTKTVQTTESIQKETTTVMPASASSDSGLTTPSSGTSESTNESNNSSNGSSSSGSTTPSQGTPSQETPSPEPSSTPVQPMTEKERYYAERGTLVKVIDADKSETVPTEQEATNILEERGFNDFPINYLYDISGNYKNITEISGSNTTSRPMYQTYYISANDEAWAIYVINGDVIAKPLTYNMHSPHEVELLVSESKVIPSYDGETNKFYVWTPGESTAILKTIGRIDAQTLDGITSGEIDGL